jgi:hypothetical protein
VYGNLIALNNTLSRQLNSPEINYSVIRPLLNRWTKNWNEAIIYALMVNRLVNSPRLQRFKSHSTIHTHRVQFLKLAESDLAYASLQTARASMCELLASGLRI